MQFNKHCGEGGIVIAVIIALAVLFLVIGVVLLCGKGSGMLAGYNTMAQEEKAKYNEKALCKITGWFMVSYATIFFVLFMTATCFVQYESVTTPICITVLLALPIGLVFYVNKSKRLKK